MSKLSLSELSDQALVRWCLARGSKDDRPFRELFQRHQQMIWRLCYRFTNNSHDAEDLTQEVFLKAYRKLAQYEGRAAFSTWLYRIGMTTCLDDQRSRSRRPTVSSTPFELLEDSLPTRSPLESLSESSLFEALSHLRPREREVLLLRDVEDYSYQEIAQQLGISLSATKMRIQRARLALQNAYRKLKRDELERE